MNKIVLVTGGFDPLHSGHIAYFEAARALGDMLIVGVNTDDWLTRKKGQPFMDEYERCRIIESLKIVDKVVCYPDADGSSKNTITGVRAMYPDAKIIFANGGDRTKENIPEMDLVDDNLEFVFGVGGEDKKNSSSWILQEWKAPKTIRPWGYYRVLHTIGDNVKVKELTVDPGKTLSMQRHQYRSELWFVAEGVAGNNWDYGGKKIKPYKTEIINPNEWHQLHNPTDKPLKVIEIQYGERCEEEDIERR
jgi:cytidyltransferase-like protein